MTADKNESDNAFLELVSNSFSADFTSRENLEDIIVAASIASDDNAPSEE